MKHSTLIILIYWLLNCLPSQAQEGWMLWYGNNQFAAQDIPYSLQKKQTQLSQRPSARVNCVGLAPDGGWVISYYSQSGNTAKPYLSWDGTHRDFMEILHPINNSGSVIQQVVFSPLLTYDKQSWVILYDDKDANWKNLPDNLIQTIVTLNQNNRKIKSIGLAVNGGWVLIADNNEVYTELIPAALQAAIDQLKAAKRELQYIAFNLDNGWVLIAAKNEAVWDKIPASLVTKIQALQTKNEIIKGINFYTIKGKL